MKLCIGKLKIIKLHSLDPGLCGCFVFVAYYYEHSVNMLEKKNIM